MLDVSPAPLAGRDIERQQDAASRMPVNPVNIDLAPADIVAALSGVDTVHFGGFGQVPAQPRWIRPDVTFVAAALAPADAIGRIARSKSIVHALTAARAAAIVAAAFAAGIVCTLLIVGAVQ